MPDDTPDMRVIFGLEPAPDNVVTTASATEVGDVVRDAFAAHQGFKLAGATRVVLSELAEVMKEPLQDVLVNAWNKRAEIQRYATPEQTASTQVHRVWLCDHTIAQQYDLTAQVEMAGLSPIRLTFSGVVNLTFKGAALVIRGGRVVRVALGEVSAKAAFTS